MIGRPACTTMGDNPMTHLAPAMGTSGKVVQCWGKGPGCHTLCIHMWLTEQTQLLGRISLQLILPLGMTLVWFLTQCEQLVGYFKIKISSIQKNSLSMKRIYKEKSCTGTKPGQVMRPHPASPQMCPRWSSYKSSY